ncbi:MAG: hypothetical protein QXW10_02010, partial [Candidatus Micrarchaeaceae archaeon]
MLDAVGEAIKGKFDEFLDSYYKEQIADIIVAFPDKRSLNVDFKDLSKFDPELAGELIENPEVIIEAANASLKEKLKDIDLKGKEPHVRFYGQNINTPLVQDIGSNYIGKLVLLDGLVVKRSEINPKVKIGFYKCTYCGATYKIRIDRDEVPEVCEQCKRKSLKQVPEESQFTNLQKLAIQDPLERLYGNVPTWQLEVWVEDDLVNLVIPGDRTEITGILRIRPRRNIRGKLEKNIYTMFLDAVSVVTKEKEFTDIPISEAEEREINELSKNPN